MTCTLRWHWSFAAPAERAHPSIVCKWCHGPCGVTGPSASTKSTHFVVQYHKVEANIGVCHSHSIPGPDRQMVSKEAASEGNSAQKVGQVDEVRRTQQVGHGGSIVDSSYESAEGVPTF